MITILQHGDVYAAEGLQDRTRVLPKAALELIAQDPENGVTDAKIPDAPLVHYRIVYKEVGKPLMQERSLSSIITAVRDTCTGTLWILHPG